MTDLIRIRGLTLKTRIGVGEEERASPQTVVIDADLFTDTSKAGASDDLADTVDYGAVVEAIADLVQSGEKLLMERLAEEIAQMLLKTAGVGRVAVEVKKADPPIDADVEAVAVRIERP
jgi:7,8-dihydroneopterin aldolase/epimerase/oxygenase